MELAKRKNWEDTIVKLIDHWDLHWKVWEHFEQVAKHRRRVGATVPVEGPCFCEYWQETKVSHLLQSIGVSFYWF